MSSVIESRGIQYSAEAAGDQGSLRCHVLRRQIAHDRRAQFTIVVCNDSDADAQALAFVPAAPGGRPRTIVQTIVGAGSNFSTSLTLGLTPAGTMPELHVAVTTDDTRFTLVVPGRQVEEACADSALALPAMPFLTTVLPATAIALNPYPRAYGANVHSLQTAPSSFARVAARSEGSPPVVPIVLVFTALVALVAFFLIRPHISALTVPENAAAGTTVSVSYRVTGVGTAAYAMLGPDGRTVATGPLALGAGRFAVSVPPAPAAQAYLIRLRMSDPIGAATAEDYLHVAATPQRAPAPARRPRRSTAAVAPPPPQIRSLALDRSSLASGETLNVYYDVLATSGSITLFDPASQVTYGRVEVSPTGRATFAAPHVDTTRLLTVVLTAQRGNATTQSRSGVTVTPSNAADISTEAGTGSGTAGSGSATVLSAPASVHSSEPIHVEIRGGAAGLDIAILDSNGNEVARRAVASGQNSIDFRAPAVRAASRFVIEGTYPSGAGSETIVRPITVLP